MKQDITNWIQEVWHNSQQVWNDRTRNNDGWSRS